MGTTINSARPSMFDLETFEFTEAPAFIIRVGSTALDFELLYTNQAFRNGRFRDNILAGDREAVLFRSWAQALGQRTDSKRICAGCTWSAEFATKSGALKVVRATESSLKVLYPPQDLKAESNESLPSTASSTSSLERTKKDYMKGPIRERPILFPLLPPTNLNARWEGIQTMLEMSDVGVFEYSLEGTLMYANKAYYRLR
jgi:hypothetical protein